MLVVQRWWRPAHGHRGGFQLPGSSLLCLTTTSQRREREVPPASSHPPPPPPPPSPPPPFPFPPTSSHSPSLLPPNLSLFFLLLLSASRMQQQRTRDQARGRTWTRSSKGMRQKLWAIMGNKWICYIPRDPNLTHCFPCELYLFCALVYFVFSLYLYSSYRVISIDCLPPHPPSSCRAKYVFVIYLAVHEEGGQGVV